MIYTPHPYQQYAIDRIMNEKHVGLLLDMGLGKTSIVLHAIAQLVLDTLEVSKVLVIAPKKVSEATWQAEARKWDSTTSLRFETVLGASAERRAALLRPADVYVINRENVPWLIEDVYIKEKRKWDFDMIVFDESSSFKNPQSKRFRSIRKVLAKTDRTVILTGTPAPNGLEDIWAQVFLLDRGERLERYPSHFREKYFDYNPWRYELKLKPGGFENVQKKISDICISMKAEDYLQLPDMTVEDHLIALDRPSRRRYEKLEREMLLEIGNEEITAMSAAALTGKLLQLCSGNVYNAEHETVAVHTNKQDMFTEVLEGLHGESALVFYGYQHELSPIADACRAAGIPDDKVRVLKDASDVDAFNSGECRVLIAHPSSCAYGLNLQQGGHHIVWYTLTWNLELYQQANARLHRQGQRFPTVVHRLLVIDSVDQDVVKALDLKTGTQEALMASLKARVQKVR